MASSVNARGLTVDGWVKILLAFTVFSLGAAAALLQRYADSVIAEVAANNRRLGSIEHRLWGMEKEIAVFEKDITNKLAEGVRLDFESRGDRLARQKLLEKVAADVQLLTRKIDGIESRESQ